MAEKTFWGEKGEYGPFAAEEDGWPNAGEVMRHYRKKLGISAKELARLYSETIGVQVTERWILKMEQENKVPSLTIPSLASILVDELTYLAGLMDRHGQSCGWVGFQTERIGPDRLEGMGG